MNLTASLAGGLAQFFFLKLPINDIISDSLYVPYVGTDSQPLLMFGGG